MQRKMTREERMKRIQDSELPLSVYIKNMDTWNLVDHVYMVGPLGERDIVIPVDFRHHQEDNIEFKLETGFMFWELDYVAIDYSIDSIYKVHRLDAAKVESKRKRAHKALLADDGQYLEQRKVGDYVNLSYPEVPVSPGQKQSVFLHCKGYYEHVRHYRGKPDLAELDKFRKPGYFLSFQKWNTRSYVFSRKQ